MKRNEEGDKEQWQRQQFHFLLSLALLLARRKKNEEKTPSSLTLLSVCLSKARSNSIVKRRFFAVFFNENRRSWASQDV